MRKSFLLYTKYAKQISKLTTMQKGLLLEAIFAFEVGEDVPELDPVTDMLWSIILEDLQDDAEKWAETCKARAEAGAKGGRPSKVNEESKEKQTKAKKANGYFAYSEESKEKQTEAKKPNNNNNSNNNNNLREREIDKEKEPAPAHKYGQYKNVLLTDEEYEKLKAEFPVDYSSRIERLSEYIASKGAKYKSHLATIRAWARKDGEEARAPVEKKNAFNSFSGQTAYNWDDLEASVLSN